MTKRAARGFSLVELLLVLAIIGIISAIAIPSFLGQRRRARVIGDAQTNVRTMAMALESRKAETGVYDSKAATLTWTASGSTPTASANVIPTFTVKGNSKMNYSLAIGSTGLTYTITVTDPFVASATVLTADQTGAVTLDAGYNK